MIRLAHSFLFDIVLMIESACSAVFAVRVEKYTFKACVLFLTTDLSGQ